MSFAGVSVEGTQRDAGRDFGGQKQTTHTKKE